MKYRTTAWSRLTRAAHKVEEYCNCFKTELNTLPGVDSLNRKHERDSKLGCIVRKPCRVHVLLNVGVVFDFPQKLQVLMSRKIYSKARRNAMKRGLKE